MKKTMKRLLLILGLFFYMGLMLNAQTIMQPQIPASFSIKGTSTLHDWEMKGTQIFGSLNVTNEGGTLKKINSASIRIPIATLKSDKTTLDNKAYEALNKDKFPNITFETTDVTMTASGKPDVWLCKSNGTITVNGTPKKKAISGSLKKLADGRFQVMLSVYLTMTEFGVKPPVMFLGSIKTADAVNINFELFFK